MGVLFKIFDEHLFIRRLNAMENFKNDILIVRLLKKLQVDNNSVYDNNSLVCPISDNRNKKN